MAGEQSIYNQINNNQDLNLATLEPGSIELEYSGLGNSDSDDFAANPSEVNLGNVFQLPAQQRQILNRLTRQPNSSIATIADQLGIEADQAQIEIDSLLKEGWIEAKRSNGQAVYAVRSISEASSLRSGNNASDSVGKGLVVILNSSGQNVLSPGESFQLGITVTNKGGKSAIIDVLLEDLPMELTSWWLTLRECLALGSSHSGEAVFQLNVPVTAQPGLYEYTLVIDAAQHYPEETPIRYPQRLQILPGVQDATYSNDPSFIVQPTTQPNKPILLQPGGGIPIQVLVHNRSDRVDRFRLTCPDLSPNWIDITYPQADSGFGVILTPDTLKLNPGEQGLIMMLISPPIDAIAGTQVGTVRLHSENHTDVMMSDWVYLQITANYLLQTELRTVINKVQQKAGLFQVRFTNLGNSPRDLTLKVKNLEESEQCLYHLDRQKVQVAPKATIGIDLTAQPLYWWKRPMFGSPKLYNFAIELEDDQQLPLPSDRLTSFVMWEPRPWWQLLPVVLLVLLGIGSFIYLIWWLLIRIPEQPKIVEFAPEASLYQALNDDAVRLSWRISQPNRLKTITIQGAAPDGKPMVLPIVYDLSKGLPEELRPYCNLQEELICRSIRTSALKPGDYIFSMTTVAREGRGAAGDTQKTAPVKIEAIPKPQIVGFNSTQPVYQEASLTPILTAAASPTANPTASSTPSSTASSQVSLNWTIENPKQIKAIHLVGKSPEGVVLSPLRTFDFSRGIPKELAPFCMITTQLACKNLPTGDRKPGNYIYELAAIGQGEGNIATQKTDVIKLLPKPARILKLTINGQSANLPKYVVPIGPNQGISTILLAWEIEASEGSKVDLLPAPGSIPLKGSLPFPLNPTPGSLTLTLQVTSPNGAPLIRSIVIETYDPNASDPSVKAAAAAAAVAAANKPLEAAPAPAPAAPASGGASGEPTPSVPGQLSPIELPPQSN
jgi:hypothetical protein